MGKKFTVLLVSLLGVSTILVYLSIGAFLFQKGLLFPEIKASPATCTVDDDLEIAGDSRSIYFGSSGETGPHGLEFSNELYMYYRTGPNNLEIEDAPGGNDIFVIDRDDREVGIGTDSPGYALDVRGRILGGGADFMLGKYDGRNQGINTLNRALVHTDWGIGNDNLVINYNGDFEGGVEIGGPKVDLAGDLSVGGNIIGFDKRQVSNNSMTIDLLKNGGWQCVGGSAAAADAGKLVKVTGEVYMTGGDSQQWAVVWIEGIGGAVRERMPMFNWVGVGSTEYAVKQSFIDVVESGGSSFGACVKNVDTIQDQEYHIEIWVEVLE